MIKNCFFFFISTCEEAETSSLIHFMYKNEQKSCSEIATKQKITISDRSI